MAGPLKDSAPRPDGGASDAERLRQFGIDFDKSVRKGVEQLRPFASHTKGGASTPSLGFDLEYQMPDRDHPIESLTVTTGNHLPGLVLATRFFTMEHPHGVFGITRTQTLKKGDLVMAQTEPQILSPEAAERVAMVAENPVMNASSIELATEPTAAFDHSISTVISNHGNDRDVSRWRTRHR